MTTSAAKKKMLPRLAAVPNRMNCGTEEYHVSRSLVLMLPAVEVEVEVEADDAHVLAAAACAGRDANVAGIMAAARGATIALHPAEDIPATEAAAPATAA